MVLGAGRGSGKTLAGSQWLRAVDKAQEMRLGADGGPLRFSLVGRTAADVRDVMLNGQSGLMNVYPPSERDQVVWTSTRREVVLPGGSVGLCFSAEEPDQLRGPQSHLTWCDELAAYKGVRGVDGLTAWDNVRIGTRLGLHPQILVTTTPKRTPEVRALWAEASNPASGVVLRRMSTDENVYLSQDYLSVLYGLYQGTAIGRQELAGELLDDVEGALLSLATIDAGRVNQAQVPDDLVIVVGVDPSVAADPRDECGIVVVGATREHDPLQRHAFVLEDRSLRGSPGTWARAVVRAAEAHTGLYPVTVVVETNQGGDMVRRTIAEAARELDVPCPRTVSVSATRSKISRAEPVAAAFERGRVHMVGNLPELEDQFTTWSPIAGYSPDRLDAAVHALSAVILSSTVRGGMGTVTVDARASRMSLDWTPVVPSRSPRFRPLPSLFRGRQGRR
jgi:phage terminase large subunit-like protein